MIRKYRCRRPRRIYEVKGVELQLAVELPTSTEYCYIYDVVKLPWRKEFDIQEELDEDGDIIVDKYIEEFFDELFLKGKRMEGGK